MVRLVILFLIETHIYSVGRVFKLNLTQTVTGWPLTKKLGNAWVFVKSRKLSENNFLQFTNFKRQKYVIREAN